MASFPHYQQLDATSCGPTCLRIVARHYGTLIPQAEAEEIVHKGKQGVDLLSLCKAAAAAGGFRRLELMSTLSGEPLYAAYGFHPLERVEDATGGAAVPLVRMEKPVDPSLLG